MTTNAAKAELFLALHHAKAPLLLPNPWDAGTAKIFEAMGFAALATTSAGHAATLGRRDGAVGLDQALTHATTIVAATALPVSADFENAFADDPAAVAVNITRAAETGLAGCSIEDATGRANDPIYDAALAAERVSAAAEAAHAGAARLVLTARAENYLHHRPDLADTIARLQSFQAAGADVLYAPGISTIEDIRSVVANVDRPVNVLALPGVPSVAELGAAGVKRVSVGSAFSLVAIAAVADAAREFLEQGTYNFWSATSSAQTVRSAFTA